jgi:hypothetical protein
MTVYVDDWRQQATVGRISARWSHMFVAPDGDLADLHAMAARIGLRRSWFQAKGWPRDHYDVTDARRERAIAAGAVPVSWREAGRWRTEAIAAARRPPDPDTAQPGGPLTEPARRFPALTVRNPWAWALLHGKPVENRSWNLGYRGPMWLHAGKAWDPGGETSPLIQAAWNRHTSPTMPMNRRPGTTNAPPGPDSPLIASGAVTALLEVTGCHHSADCTSQQTGELCSPWALHGSYHIEITVTATLPRPLPCAGRQKLWALPNHTEHAARTQLNAETL